MPSLRSWNFARHAGRLGVKTIDFVDRCGLGDGMGPKANNAHTEWPEFSREASSESFNRPHAGTMPPTRGTPIRAGVDEIVKIMSERFSIMYRADALAVTKWAFM